MTSPQLHWLRHTARALTLFSVLGLVACGGESSRLAADEVRVVLAGEQSLSLASEPVLLTEGEWEALSVIADVDGETIDATNLVEWSTEAASIAYVDAEGVLRAQNAGSTHVTARYNSLTYTFRVIVTDAPCVVNRVFVSGRQSAGLNETLLFQAMAKCSDNESVQNPVFDWASSNTSVLTIDGNGIGRTVGAGTATVTARHSGVTGQVAVNVEGEQTLTLSTVADGFEYPSGFCPEKSLTLLARNDQSNQFVNARFTSTDPSVASLNGIILNAIEAGTTRITATAGTATGSMDISVPNCDSPPFDGLILRAKPLPGWNSVHIYAWDESGAEVVKYSSDWPGTPMNEIEDGWYEFRMPGIYQTDVIFNNGASGAANQTGDMRGIASSGWCTLEAGPVCDWSEVGPIIEPPQDDLVARVSPANGTTFTGSATVRTNWFGNAIKNCSYSTDGTNPAISGGQTCSNGGSFSVGENLQIGESVTVVVCSESAMWDCANYTYTKAEKSAFEWDNATIYFVVTDRFNDGNSSNNTSYGRESGSGIGMFQGGDVAGLTQKLNEDYFTDLGVTALWITAPYEQVHGWVWGTGDEGSFHHYGYHGYYPLDYTVMDKNMGSKAEFREFVDTAHAKGIRVVMDIVMNHAGYATVKDVQDFNIDVLNGSAMDWSSTNWVDWWGPNWVRAGLGGGYEDAGCGIDDCPLLANVDFLPDFKTESNENVGLPNFLSQKADTEARPLNTSVRGHIISWLSDWVREYGIDGFRADTVKHVDAAAWNELKQSASVAYEDWKRNNGGSPFQDDTPFWMTGEYWNHGAGNNAPNGQRYQDSGFDSMINFEFQHTAPSATNNLASIDSAYHQIANVRNNGLGLLSYLSSHDTHLFFDGNTNRQKSAGSLLLMAPGPVQIFYGDETARRSGPDGGVPMQATRTFMNWSGLNSDVLNHWQKLGQFRRDHTSIGTGQHDKISDSPYTFSRTAGDDQVVVVMGAAVNQAVTVNVSGIFADGASLTDYYNGNTATVSGGSVSFASGPNGTLLIAD